MPSAEAIPSTATNLSAQYPLADDVIDAFALDVNHAHQLVSTDPAEAIKYLDGLLDHSRDLSKSPSVATAAS